MDDSGWGLEVTRECRRQMREMRERRGNGSGQEGWLEGLRGQEGSLVKGPEQP